MATRKLISVGLKNSRYHLLRTFLLITGIALGVAVIIAIDIANTGVSESFDLSGKVIAGKATHQIVGINDSLDQGIYTRLKTELGIRKCTPVITGFTSVQEFQHQEFQILGVDIFSMNDFRSLSAGSGEGSRGPVSLSELLKPGSVLISSGTAESFHVEKGQVLHFLFGETQKDGFVSGILTNNESGKNDPFATIIISDIAVAQELLGMGDNLSRIDLILDETPEKMVHSIRQILPQGAVLVSMDKKNASLRRMSRSFEINIAAFSILGLFMGVFLIFNTVNFSITQRKKQFGIMRAMGVTGHEIVMMILGETAVFSLFGGVIGIFSGIILGNLALKVVTGTVSGLFFHLSATASGVSIFSLIKGFTAGVITTLAAALYPAVIAGRIKPVSLFRRSQPELQMKKRIPVFTFAGVFCILTGVGLLYLLTTSLVYNFLGIFLIFTGASLLVPLLTSLFLSVLGKIIRRFFFPFLKLSLLNLNRSLSRMVVSISSLMIMISVFIGIGLMTGSFRNSIIMWSETSIVGDLIISSSNELTDRIPEGFETEVREMDQVEDVLGVTVIRNFSETTGHFIIFASEKIMPGKNWIHGPDQDMDASFQDDAIFVSEVFAFQNRLTGKEGETVILNTQKGEIHFRVAGIFQDFFTGGGRIEISRNTLKRYWETDHLTDLHIFAAPGVPPSGLAQEIKTRFGNKYAINIRENKTIRERIVEAFDNTFMITVALQLLAAIVAVIGIFNSAMAVFSERERESGTLRACGLSRFETGRLMVTECGLCGFTAGILSIPLGIILAWILVFMINKRSFGWSYDFILNFGILAQALLLSVLASVAAGLFPSVKSANTDITSALSYE